MTTYNIPHFGLKRQYADLREQLLHATDIVLTSGTLMYGYQTKAFEEWLAQKTGNKFASVVHSGTQALEIIARYSRDRADPSRTQRPKIYIPNLSYPATLNAFLTTDWDVELVDTNSHGLMPDDSEYGIQGLNTYVCYVGLFGATSREHPAFNAIYDGAQHWLAQQSGNAGAGMAISFDPTKNLNASGNGGAIVTNSPHLHRYVVSYKCNGKPNYDITGTNSTMSELDCAHLLVRAAHIDIWQNRRKAIRMYYLDQFSDLPFKCLSRGIEYHADQKFVIYTDQRNDLDSYLRDAGIETKIHYPYALSELDIARKLIRPDMLSTSVMLTRGVLSLPIYPELTDPEVEYIADTVKKFYARAN